MSNTVITNYTDLNGPSTKADSSVVVIVNKDGSLSVDQNLLGTLMGTDGTQAAGISVVRVGHEGKPDDATDSESEDDKIPHVTLSVDSYFDEPNSIIKYDSGAEMLQSLRIETRENSLIGFQNDHCYTPFTSPSQSISQTSDNFTGYEEPVIEITHTPPPKPVPSSKKITILEQQIIPKGKKIVLNATESPIILKGQDVLNKPLPIISKAKNFNKELEKTENLTKTDESTESSSISSSDSLPDRDSDSDYKDTKDRSGSLKLKKAKLKPRILKNIGASKPSKLDPKIASRLKINKSVLKKEIKEKINSKSITERKQSNIDIETLIPTSEISVSAPTSNEHSKIVTKSTPKPVKKEKKTPSHVTALLSDMTSLFSTPDVIRRVSTENKPSSKSDKDSLMIDKKGSATTKSIENANEIKPDAVKLLPESNIEKPKSAIAATPKYIKQKDKTILPDDKVTKGFELTATIPQLDEASLAQILQDTPSITTNPVKMQPTMSTASAMNSPGLAGPLSPTLDLLGGLQPEEEGLTEDLLMHVAQLVESSENLQEVIDKQVLGKVDTIPPKPTIQTHFQQTSNTLYAQTLTKSAKNATVRKDPIEIVRRDGRVITLPPIEAPATRASKRKSQMESSSVADVVPTPPPAPVPPIVTTPEPQVQTVSKQYVNKKMINKKQEQAVETPVVDKVSAESQESWNSEDDPYRLWCICKQPHNNRFMICCDSCEDWFHGKCVNITKAMGQQMEEQGIEWRCPNCIKKTKTSPKSPNKATADHEKSEPDTVSTPQIVTKDGTSKTNCIVCKKAARATSIYCSDGCILKHAQDSLGNQPPNKAGAEPGGNSQEKKKSDSRVIVFERKTGRLLAGPNAPTAENLKTWLQKNPTFEVVRPGTLSTIKPNTTAVKKLIRDSNKIQTTLNFERIPRKSLEQQQPSTSKVLVEPKSKNQQTEGKIKTPTNNKPKLQELKLKTQNSETKFIKTPHAEKSPKVIPSPKEEVKVPQPKTPIATRSHPSQNPDTPKASTSTGKTASEPRKLMRTARAQSASDKVLVSPSTSRRKDPPDSNKKMDSSGTIRENVRKALQEQLSQRMAENTGPKFTEQEIKKFSNETEYELHELFRDVGMKYKAKYRSLMFNIKDRKNLSLWQKICDHTITPKQLVRLSPEELASQELAQWRDQEAKHQLELIKKSELDLLAASKTYVLKTHKGEEVIETKESVATELDPNVAVEDLVTALNVSAAGETTKEEETSEDFNTSKSDSSGKKHGSSRKRGRLDDSSFESTKKERRDSKRDTESRKSRSSKRKSDVKQKESKDERRSTRRSDKRSSRAKSASRDRSREDKEKREHSRHRSRSRAKSKRRSKSREHSRSHSHSHDRSHSRERSKRRSPSVDSLKRKRRSRSKHLSSTDDKHKHHYHHHRSRSQDNVYSKNKNDSTDSDSVERPKSAMLKEVHPEYDPHEPMITSAFSEEDLRKSREDVYDIEEYRNNDYEPSKSFSIDFNVAVNSAKNVDKQDKISEPESDQEPSSTVDNSAVIVWNGCINMVDVARFYVAAHEVSGSASDLEEDLSAELDIVGRINPDTVWDYIGKMKRASNKDIVILRLQAANDEEKMQYIALYSYLSSRNRLGVVKVSSTTSVKDFYIVPIPANTTLPAVLLPLDGPGMGDVKTHHLIAIVIRQRKKRLGPNIPKDIIPAKAICIFNHFSPDTDWPHELIRNAGSVHFDRTADRIHCAKSFKVSRESRKRSYTPPIVSKSSYTPPTSPRRRAALPLPAYTSPALSTSVKDKIAASLAAADDEAYSPGSSSSSGSITMQPSSNTLRTKMEELNRQIEEQKQQILKMTRTDSSVAGDDEAYSPSRPMTPPAVVPLADIALPSNLQEILATIKQRSEPAQADVDMRTLPP